MNITKGFKVVPEVATLEMKNAGWRECDRQGIEPESIEMQSIWTAMHLDAPALLQASQPVTMANVMRAYEYACDHPDKYLRGTSNWCAAVAWKLNQLESPATTPPQPIYDEAVNAAVLGAQNLNAAMATIDILRAQLAERDALLTDLGVEPDGVSDVYQRLLLNAERYEYLREHMAVENFPSEHPDWSQPSEYESRRIDEFCDSAMSRAKAGEDE